MTQTIHQENDDFELSQIFSEILTEANFRNRRRMGAEGEASQYRNASDAAQAAEDIENGRRPNSHRRKTHNDESSYQPAQGIGGSAERRIEELSRKYNEDVDKLYEQGPAEISAQTDGAVKIAKLLGIDSGSANSIVEVTIGRIQNAKSIWWSRYGLQKFKAANNNFVNAADGSRVPKGVMADRFSGDEKYKDRPEDYYSSGARLSGGISTGITPTIGTFANCVEVSIDWGQAGDSLDKLIQVVKNAGLDLPGKGFATRDVPKDWARVVVWTVRYLIWNSIYNLLEKAGFNVEEDVIMAVADTGGDTNVITRLRFAINTATQNVLKANKKLAESIGDYCLAKINVTSKKTFNRYIGEIVRKWSDTEGRTFFTPKGGVLCDLLNELSMDSTIRSNDIDVFSFMKLPDISTTIPERMDNSVQKERYASYAKAYNERASKFNTTDQIFDEICWPLFANIYDESNMLETAIAEREARKESRPGRIEFEQMDPDWVVSRYNFISARNAVERYDTDRMETAVTKYDGSVRRVSSFTTGAYGIPADKRWKPADTSESESYEGKANQEFSRLKDLATIKV